MTGRLIEKLSGIPGLEAAAALKAMGGKAESYLRVAAVTARRLPDEIGKLDNYIDENDKRGYAVAIHGVKSVLNGIGAFEAGSLARSLEIAAKADDTGFRKKNYPLFKENVLNLTHRMQDMFRAEEDPEGSNAGMKNVLDMKNVPGVEVFARAREAAEDFDNQRAIELLAPYKGTENIDGIITALEDFDYPGAAALIARFERGIV